MWYLVGSMLDAGTPLIVRPLAIVNRLGAIKAKRTSGKLLTQMDERCIGIIELKPERFYITKKFDY